MCGWLRDYVMLQYVKHMILLLLTGPLIVIDC